MLRVYTASKLTKGEMWRRLHEEWPEVFFHARWLKHNVIGTEDSPRNAKRFWIEDEEDVQHADIILVYAEPDDHLKGALVEVGMGIAYGKRIAVIGEHPDYSTWQYHPRVEHYPTLSSFRSRLALEMEKWKFLEGP